MRSPEPAAPRQSGAAVADREGQVEGDEGGHDARHPPENPGQLIAAAEVEQEAPQIPTRCHPQQGHPQTLRWSDGPHGAVPKATECCLQM
jgi:hypothetical protein